MAGALSVFYSAEFSVKSKNGGSMAANVEEIASKRINQIIHWFGDGRLLDGSQCSQDLRAFLSEVPSKRLGEFVEHCLTEPFDNSGLVLQDLINEFGRRLDFEAENGRYKGKQGAIGYDGIWRHKTHDFVIEVKTTDAYTIRLDTIAGYRQELLRAQKIKPESSILLVVGRHDTGSIEAQVRGSRYAWDVRIVSADSLAKLVTLKEETEEDTSVKITEILKPIEYTRVDKIIELAFSAAREAGDGDEITEDEPDTDDETQRYVQEHTPRKIIDSSRERALSALSQNVGVPLIRKSKALYWSPDQGHQVRAVATVSKRYKGRFFWYAYHPTWDAFLAEGASGYFLLAGIGLPQAYAIPRAWIHSMLPRLNTTKTEDKTYYHIHLEQLAGGAMQLKHAAGEVTSVEQFALRLPPVI
jgi:hypothetical protein